MSCARCHTHTDLLGKPYCIIRLDHSLSLDPLGKPYCIIRFDHSSSHDLLGEPYCIIRLDLFFSFLSACICISHAYTPRAFDPHRFSRIHLSSAAYFSFSRIGTRDFPSVFFVCDLHASLYATHEHSKTEFKYTNSMNARFSEPSDQYITASSEILFTSRAFSGRLHAFPDRPFSMFRSLGTHFPDITARRNIHKSSATDQLAYRIVT